MRLYPEVHGPLVAAAALVLVAQPAWAATTNLTGVQLKTTTRGVELVLTIQGNNRPAISTVARGNSIIADIAGAQLRLPGYAKGSLGEQGSFRQNNPVPGITSISVKQLDANKVRVLVSGVKQDSFEQVVRQNNQGLVLSFNRVNGENSSGRASREVDQSATSEPSTPSRPFSEPSTPSRPFSEPSTPSRPFNAGQNSSSSTRLPQPNDARRSPVAPLRPTQAPSRGSQPASRVGQNSDSRPAAIPQPRVNSAVTPSTSAGWQPPRTNQNFNYDPGTVPRTNTVNQRPATATPLPLPSNHRKPNPSTSSRSRAVAPPVGDIAVATVDITPGVDDQGQLIMRTYRLNQIKATSSGRIAQRFITKATTGGSVGDSNNGSFSRGNDSDSESVNTPISLETTAETGIGRSVERTETVPSQGAKEILIAFGANGTKARPGSSRTETNSSDTNDTETFDDSSDDESSSSGGTKASLLRGLEVIAEARTNTVTLIGSPRVVEIATNLLTQFDIRRRQVAVNIKIVDVDLTKGRNANADIQYRLNNTVGLVFGQDPRNDRNIGFTGILGRGSSEPDAIGRAATGIEAAATGIGAAANLARNILANVFVSIQDQSAKILTNPTLVVQEGSSAQVNLTQEIFSGVETTEDFSDSDNDNRLRTKPIIRPAGVIVNVTVDHIDDNGFVSLSVSPEVSAPSGTYTTSETTGTLLAQRRLETGQVRLRDGQTLILTGIIQDQDRVNVSKVPILGDIPLLGRLFRREEKTNERREVVVVVTPQILDDHESQQPATGDRYKPTPEVQKLLDR